MASQLFDTAVSQLQRSKLHTCRPMPPPRSRVLAKEARDGGELPGWKFPTNNPLYVVRIHVRYGLRNRLSAPDVETF